MKAMCNIVCVAVWKRQSGKIAVVVAEKVLFSFVLTSVDRVNAAPTTLVNEANRQIQTYVHFAIGTSWFV